MTRSLTSVPERLDTVIGDGLDAAVRVKHRWRLRRLGHPEALAPPDDGLWAAGDPPPRDGCRLDVLIDGAQAFPMIAEALAACPKLRAHRRLARRAPL